MSSSASSSFGLEDLARYLQTIRSVPMLASDEELSLARRWTEHRAIDALHKLVTSHLRLVVKIAMGYRGYGLPIDDLIAEGNVGMMKAAKKFDPDRGVRLSTYAMWWIRSAIQEYVLRSWSLVKIGTTASQKKLFFNLKRIKRQLSIVDEGDLAPEHTATIARCLDVSEQEVVGMTSRIAGHDYSLNVPMGTDGDAEMQDWLVDDRPDQEAQLAAHREQQDRKALLTKAMEQLSDREKRILVERRLRDRPVKLQNLAAEFGVSCERIRQIENRAFKKLRLAMTRRVDADEIRRGPVPVQLAHFGDATAAFPHPVAGLHSSQSISRHITMPV